MDEDDVEELVSRYEAIAPDSLQLAVWYDGDDYDVVHARDDIREMYTPEEFDEQVKQLIVEGLAVPPQLEQFRLFGEMDVAVRRFEKAMMLHFPADEFAGLAVTIDRGATTSIDTLADIGAEYFDESRSQSQ